jgi:hypothetical protein
MSTAIIKVEDRCFNRVSKSDKGVKISKRMSAGRGRADI